MSILQKLHLTLLPCLIVFLSTIGILGYNAAKEYSNRTYLNTIKAEVNSALIAAEYEQLGLLLSVKDIAASSSFLRYIQNPKEFTNLASLERRILTNLERNNINQYGERHFYLVDPQFNLIFSTFRQTPFEDLNLPDKVFQSVFDIHTKILNQDPFSEKGLSYITSVGDIQYVYIMAIDPFLLPRDKRSKTSPYRYLLIAESPLKQMSDLVRRLNNSPGLSLSFNPTESNQLPENTEFVIQSIKYESDSINVDMLSKHFSAKVNIHESKTSENNKVIAKYIFYITIVTILGCLIIYHIAIIKQISAPLKKLLFDIFNGSLQSRYLKRSSGKSEIDKIKNSYIDSLIELKFEAEFDQITKLTNRHTFFRHLKIRLSSANNINCYLVCWDIIDFKKVNDLYGSKFGDEVLYTFSKLFYDTLINHHYQCGFSCSDYSIGRYGGNQFIAVIEVSEENTINIEIDKINKILSSTIYIKDFSFKLSLVTCILPMNATNFISSWPRSIEQMLRYTKRNTIGDNIVHAKDLLPILEREDLIESILTKCCNKDLFNLYFMPIFNVKTMAIDGAEVLIRCPVLNNIGSGPDEFIPIAEKSNLISSIDMWVIKKAIQCLKALLFKHEYKGTLSINVSAMELYNRNFVSDLKDVIETSGIQANSLVIEITETSYVKSSSLTIETIEGIRSLGVKVSLDDFGTGYTAFNQLLHYPVDEIKIDKSFIDKIPLDSSGKKMVEQMVRLGQSCNASVVAEGVELAEQYYFLNQIGCDYLQGYYLSKPISFRKFIKLLKIHDADTYLSSLPKQTVVVLQHKPG
ncbi:GGDEF-domain containing protein [Vibrio azureus]|uniref:GGDEF domain-containing phosphodiesterase n=1 Tax=Vibrio azureus TaxID=512649 RepID=UPI00051917EE|nr:GGDEF domain-containing phosphodiesterase [Vibrio azureus]AUI85977.1 GGDEF-domain containing protein [Vibrio azureus]